MQFKGKLKSYTWENSEKSNFGPNFDPFDPNLWPTLFFMSSTTNSSYALFQAIILGNLKEN